MAKLWEVDFTRFNPTGSTRIVDNVSDELGPYGTGTITKTSVIPGFAVRPGVLFAKDESIGRYSFDPGVYSKQYFTASYTYRSFVIWYYSYGNNWEQRAPIWGEHSASSTSVADGWRSTNNYSDARPEYWVNGSDRVFYPQSFVTTAGWKLMVSVVDRPANQIRIYGRSSVEDYSTTIASVHDTSYNYWCKIGDSDYDTGKECNMALGYVATYDHALSVAEIDAIESAFLVDSLNGDDSFATLTGIVVDESFNPAIGVEVVVYNNDLDELTAKTVSAAGGVYSADIPYPGNYTVMASRPPISGSVAEPFVVNSNGTITFIHL